MYKYNEYVIFAMLTASQYFDILNTYITHTTDDFTIYQALADPKKSQELTEFVQDIVHNETSLLMREHNDVIQMQRNDIAYLRSEIDKLHRERMDNINSHAAEVQSLHVKYTEKLKHALVDA